METETKKRRYTKAKGRAVGKYVKENYDTITIRTAKGKKERYRKMAKQLDLSLNRFLEECVETCIREHGPEWGITEGDLTEKSTPDPEDRVGGR